MPALTFFLPLRGSVRRRYAPFKVASQQRERIAEDQVEQGAKNKDKHLIVRVDLRQGQSVIDVFQLE